MAKLIRVRLPPKGCHFSASIDEREVTGDILGWCKKHLLGTVYWDRTGFPRGRISTAPSNKRNFADCFYVYRLWFTKRSDAAFVRLRWSSAFLVE